MELLSPAGSFESLRAAVQSGADAVYLGGSKFGARKSAKNFTDKEMKKWIEYCHIYGVAVYVTVNTLIKDSEIEQLCKYIKMLSDIDVDAVLVQDFAAVRIIKESAPQLPIHASTQMTATSIEDVRFLENLGFERVVLSRELSFEEIKYISENTSCELEVFVHGAICMCYSGQCLFSSIVGGRSGNRGACAQPCRLPYTVIDKNSNEVFGGYVLSPRDLCLVSKIGDLKKIGVKSLKIEGRLKRSEYVSAVTGIYRKYIDFPQQASKQDITELKNAFARGFTMGLFGGEGDKIINHKNPSNAAINVFTDEAKRRTAENIFIRKIPIFINAQIQKDDTLKVFFSDGENYACVESQKSAEKAINSPLSKDRLKSNLLKLGETPYSCDGIEICMDENITIPISEINAARREATKELSRLRSLREKRQTFDFEKSLSTRFENNDIFIACDVSNQEQAQTAENMGVKRIYVPNGVKAATCEVIHKCGQLTSVDNSSGECLEVNMPGEIYKHKNSRLFGSERLNITNSESLKFYSDYISDSVLSCELNLKEIKKMQKHIPVGILGYGRLDLMICAACPLKNAGLCQNHKMKYSLKDRKGNIMPLQCGEKCTMHILNSKPIYIADKADDFKDCGISFVVLKFTTETKEECEKIISSYMSAFSGGHAEAMPENSFTRGHFYRGVI